MLFASFLNKVERDLSIKKKKKTGRNCSLELIVCIVKNLNFKKGYLDISVFFEEKLRSSWFFGMDVN